MRSLPLLVLLVMPVLLAPMGPPAARAQSEIPTDGIGIYTEPEACFHCANFAPFAMVTVYLVALMPSDLSGIASWECRLYTQPDPLLAGLTVTPSGGGANELVAPNYRVTLPAPLAWDQTVVLATLSTFYLGGELLFGIGPCQPSSVGDPGGPAYRGAAPNSAWTRLTAAHWADDMPSAPDGRAVFGINSDNYSCQHWPLYLSRWCVSVSEEQQSWGAIKGLYR